MNDINPPMKVLTTEPPPVAETKNELDEIKTVTINGLEFQLSNLEFEHLMKFDEDQRLAVLCSIRYEFHVLAKGGKKKPDTMTKIISRNAIRFATEFVKHGMKK